MPTSDPNAFAHIINAAARNTVNSHCAHHADIYSPDQIKLLAEAADPAQTLSENGNPLETKGASYFDVELSFKILMEVLLVAKTACEIFLIWKKGAKDELPKKDAPSPNSFTSVVVNISVTNIASEQQLIETVSKALQAKAQTTFVREQMTTLVSTAINEAKTESGADM